MNALPILYSFRRCPYAMRARMALQVSGQSVRLREVVLRDKPPEMIAISPKATVPVLQLEDDRVLEESLEIMLWALARNDPENWLEHRQHFDRISAHTPAPRNVVAQVPDCRSSQLRWDQHR
ncbi:MAG: glutathione S-transferase N-terminal domain-containing protein, partial [Pseudomonadota bacterium]